MNPITLTDGAGDTVDATLTTDHPASSHSIPVMVIDGTPYGPADLIARGYRIIEPVDGLTFDTCGEVDRYLGQMPQIAWCHRCGWLWVMRGLTPPGACPRCHKTTWRTPRKA